MESPTLSRTSDEGERWSMICGKIPKQQAIYFCQIIVVFTVVIASIVNLSFSDSQQALWASILSGSVGYILPAPKIRKKKRNVALLSDAPEQQFV